MGDTTVRVLFRAAITALVALLACALLPAPANASQSVHRFYNTRTGTHFYTADEAERADVQRRFSSAFTYEGVGYRTPQVGDDPVLDCRLVPLFRFFNLRTGSHFYTTSVAERDDVIARYPQLYRYEGIAYPVVGTACAQVHPVYRFYNTRTGTHFYTVSDAEKALVEAQLSEAYHFEGIAYYALAQTDTTPPRVKNIIIMIGDGMGFEALRMTDYYLYGDAGHGLPSMSFASAMSTYSSGGCYDPIAAWNDLDWIRASQTDSAAAATALSTGTKTRPPRVGMSTAQENLTHLMEAAETHGMATGVVSTMPLSHATPAGFVAHVPNRDQYQSIAAQMIGDSATDAIIACGHPYYTNEGTPRSEPDYTYIAQPTWDALVAGTAGADADRDGDADPWTFVTSPEDVRALAYGPVPPRVCSVVQVFGTLQQGRSGDPLATAYEVPFTPGLPTLAEMSAAALNVLDEDPDGFVLMIEGGAIDQAAHMNATARVIEETADFESAVRSVDAWVSENSSWEETLLIVTADHETGRPSGPGSGMVEGQVVWSEVTNNGPGVMPGVQWHSDDHTAALVPFFAKGSAASRFLVRATGVDPVRGGYLDNTDIARVCFPMLDE